MSRSHVLPLCQLDAPLRTLAQQSQTLAEAERLLEPATIRSNRELEPAAMGNRHEVI
jgi:hypothetical protein